MDADTILQGLRNETLDRGEIEDPALRAVAEFAEWLAFPTELGDYPDSIRILDARRMYWPPSREEIPLWLLQFEARDPSGLDPDVVGVGLVGSVTFSMSGCETDRRPHDDVYAIHCYWELDQAGALVESREVSEDQLSAALRGSEERVPAELRPLVSVLLPGGTAAVLASGRLEGEEGWLVCDGARTTWYPASGMPAEAPPDTVLMIHVGRVLLGMPTRGVARPPVPEPPPLPDGLFLERYERLLAEARAAGAEEQEELFDSWGSLGAHAERYLTLIHRQEPDAARAFLLELAGFWQHNSGYAELGRMAHEMGLHDLTIEFLERLRDSYPHYYRSEAMGLLARTYAEAGRREEGVELLARCLALLDQDAESATGGDVDLYAQWRQAHVRALQVIAPDQPV